MGPKPVPLVEPFDSSTQPHFPLSWGGHGLRKRVRTSLDARLGSLFGPLCVAQGSLAR